MSPLIAAVLDGSSQFCVLHADNADVLPTIPDKGVTHVITDPPYGSEVHTAGRRVREVGANLGAASGRKTVSAPLSFSAITQDSLSSVSGQISRTPARWVIVFSQVEWAMRWQASLTSDGELTPRRIGVWVKPDGQPQFSGDRPGMGYESIVFCHRKGRSAWNGGGRVGVFTHNKNTPGGAHFHETQKPLPLMLELVELFTDPGDIVLDPFCGSGTTGVACIRLGRRFIGIEKDAKYAAVAQERLAAESRGLNLRDARAGQTSIFDVVTP